MRVEILFTERDSTSRDGIVPTIDISDRSFPHKFKFLMQSSLLVFVLSVISSAVSVFDVITHGLGNDLEMVGLRL